MRTLWPSERVQQFYLGEASPSGEDFVLKCRNVLFIHECIHTWLYHTVI